MDNTLYIGLSRQSVMMRRMDFIAHNIANADTTGFKAERPLFVQHLEKTSDGEEIAMVTDFGSIRDMSEGALRKTGNPLDAAIDGDAFFVVGLNGEERYTRNGHFELDEEGRLVTSAGHPLLDIDGREILIGAADTEITIGPDGTISSPAGVLARLNLVTFDRPQDLERGADSLLTTTQAPVEPRGASVVQGVVENSNVVPVVEMTNMIKVLRSYQSMQKLMDVEHNQQRDAIEKIMRT